MESDEFTLHFLSVYKPLPYKRWLLPVCSRCVTDYWIPVPDVAARLINF